MGKSKKTKAIKEIKKRWCTIVAPEMFSKAYMGESLVADNNQMIGKTITANLMDLTKSIKQQNIAIKFRINEVKDNEALTEVIAYEMNAASIKRFIRKNIEKVDDSFVVATNDGKFIRIKPMVMTRSAAKGSVLTTIRKDMRNYLIKEIATISYDEFVRSVVSNKVQFALSERLNKIFPVKLATIRMFVLVPNMRGKKLPTAEDLPERESDNDEATDEEQTEEGVASEESEESNDTEEESANEDSDESDDDEESDEDDLEDDLKDTA